MICERRIHTIDGALELLAAHFAGKVAYATLLIDIHRDGLFVVAEETRELLCQRLVLRRVSVALHCCDPRGVEWHLFLSLRLLCGLAFALQGAG